MTATALITVALGVGGSTAVFSVVYAVMLRPLPYPQPDRLVELFEDNRQANMPMLPSAGSEDPPRRRYSYLTCIATRYSVTRRS